MNVVTSYGVVLDLNCTLRLGASEQLPRQDNGDGAG
jgi:hypothetical protein